MLPNAAAPTGYTNRSLYIVYEFAWCAALLSLGFSLIGVALFGPFSPA